MDNRLFKTPFPSRYVPDGTLRALRRFYVSVMEWNRKQIRLKQIRLDAAVTQSCGNGATRFFSGDCPSVGGRMVNVNLRKENLRRVERNFWFGTVSAGQVLDLGKPCHGSGHASRRQLQVRTQKSLLSVKTKWDLNALSRARGCGALVHGRLLGSLK
jgi:hypothetical protein